MEDPKPTPGNDPTPPNPQGDSTPPGDPTPLDPPEKSYTQQDLDDAIAAAVEKAKEGWKAEQDEAAKLAKMSAEEREKAQFEKRQKEFDEKEAAYKAEKLEFECTKLLAADNLPVEFASMLTGADADTTKKNIETFKGAFSKAIEAAVTERLKGKPPKMPGDPNKETDPFLSGFGM